MKIYIYIYQPVIMEQETHRVADIFHFPSSQQTVFCSPLTFYLSLAQLARSHKDFQVEQRIVISVVVLSTYIVIVHCTVL